MQIAKHGAQLHAGIERFLHGKVSTRRFLQVLFQRFALDEVHHEIPAPAIGKMVIDARQIGVSEIRQQERFMFEGFGSFGNLLW